ncbi:MAG TPA: TIGR03067 domain-containing protein [Polyangia bacterium]
MDADTYKLVQDEIAKFQGTWKQVAYERDGVAEPQDDEQGWQPRTTFAGNSFVVTIADGSTPIRGTFTLDPTQEPKAVDYTDTFGADAGKTFLAVYYFESDRLIFCAAGAGLPRPTAFKTKAGQVLRTNVRESEAQR